MTLSIFRSISGIRALQRNQLWYHCIRLQLFHMQNPSLLTKKTTIFILEKIVDFLVNMDGFCTWKICKLTQWCHNCFLCKALIPEILLNMLNVTRKCLDTILRRSEVKNSQKTFKSLFRGWGLVITLYEVFSLLLFVLRSANCT